MCSAPAPAPAPECSAGLHLRGGGGGGAGDTTIAQRYLIDLLSPIVQSSPQSSGGGWGVGGELQLPHPSPAGSARMFVFSPPT